MTNEEYLAARAQVESVETEIAEQTRLEHACIEKAREFNEACRVARTKRTGLAKAIEPARLAIREHEQQVAIEQKRLASEAAAAEAAKRAEEPQPKSELQLLRESVEELRARIAESTKAE